MVEDESLDTIAPMHAIIGSLVPLELPGDIISSIKQQNKGRANGLFMDSLDVFIRLAHKDCAAINQSLRILFQCIYNQKIGKKMEAFFTNSYLFLYKDVIDPHAMRPIGIPTALQRILANHLAMVLRKQFAAHLLPHNFAVGIDGGMDFVIKTAQLLVKKYITKPQ